MTHPDRQRAPVLPADEASLALAARALRDGGLVAFPTETVYGLGADATDARAVARIFAAKGRPRFNPLIAHLAEPGDATAHGELDDTAQRLATAFWPGALTLVVPHRPGSPICALARAGLDTVALRVPAHPLARRLLAAVGRPVAAPSANRSGHVSATRAAHVADDLGDAVDVILDGGATEIGLESSIVACLGGAPCLLRPGGISREALEDVAGLWLEAAGEAVIAPGALASHYAPRARLRLDASEVAPGEALIAFGPDLPPGADAAALVVNLSPRGDLIEAAAHLFEALRRLDESGVAHAAVMLIPGHGLGLAIRDRLQRAAAPRP